MANRAYLYVKKGKELAAISEYNYEIPIAYKILVSCKTRRVKSTIFRTPLKIALQGDFEQGVERLYAFLEELRRTGLLSEKELGEKIKETKTFLGKQRGSKFFLLEGAEVYEYDGPALIGNLKMRRQISRIEKEIESFYQELEQTKSDERIQMIGIQEWADCLYYEAE